LFNLPLALLPAESAWPIGLSSGALWAVAVLGVLCTALGRVVYFTLVTAMGDASQRR
jgi:drug/metabolite transporter (DMT)-like permease